MTTTLPASPTRPAIRWTWLVVGSLLTAATVLFGTFNIVDVLAHGERTDTDTVDGPIGSVVIDNSAGDIDVIVRTDGIDAVTVTETIGDGLRSTGITRERSDDRLLLSGTCPNFGGTWCSVTYLVEVPPGTNLRLRTDDGGIAVVGAAGDVDVRSTDGRVRVVGVAGPVVVAHSEHGSVVVESSVTPSRVQATSEHGNVQVAVPDGTGAFRVDASTDHGRTLVAVRTDPDSADVIVARSEHGNVDVVYSS